MNDFLILINVQRILSSCLYEDYENFQFLCQLIVLVTLMSDGNSSLDVAMTGDIIFFVHRRL